MNLSKLFDKFNEIMKKKILPFSCKLTYDLLLSANGFKVNEYVR
jgi:hypothetical protein